jgi:hypothetical protein
MRRWKPFKSLWTAAAAVALLIGATTRGATAQPKPSRGVTSIVFVHGAWADGSSWSKVIPLLEARGFHVDAVQLPLTSQANDVASVQRAYRAGRRPAPACRSLIRRSRDHPSRE